MSTINIRATFQGRDGSEGYNHGQSYELKLFEDFNSELWIHPHKKHYQGLTGNNPRPVPYSNWVAFLRNWKEVTLLVEETEKAV